jgi:hypothetical protein
MGRLVPNPRKANPEDGTLAASFDWTPPHLSPAYGYRPSKMPEPSIDPVVPAPVIVPVHKVNINATSKSGVAVWDRKHRGISRNVLGGFYTS